MICILDPSISGIPHLLLELARQRASLSIPSIMDILSKQNKMADPHAFAQLAHFGGSDADEYEDVSDTRSVGMSLETEMRDEIGAAALLELQRHTARRSPSRSPSRSPPPRAQRASRASPRLSKTSLADHEDQLSRTSSPSYDDDVVHEQLESSNALLLKQVRTGACSLDACKCVPACVASPPMMHAGARHMLLVVTAHARLAECTPAPASRVGRAPTWSPMLHMNDVAATTAVHLMTLHA